MIRVSLDRTKPPILEIVRDFEQVYGAQPVLYVTEVHEVNEPKALRFPVAIQFKDHIPDILIMYSIFHATLSYPIRGLRSRKRDALIPRLPQ